MKRIFSIVSLLPSSSIAGKAEVQVESFNCEQTFGQPEGAVASGQSIYSDTEDWTILSIDSETGFENLGDTYLIQTTQTDFDLDQGAVAWFRSESPVQYILAVPRGFDGVDAVETIPDWMKNSHWTQINGASISVSGPESESNPVLFDLFQKKYLADTAMTMGPNAKRGDSEAMMFVLHTTYDHGDATRVGLSSILADDAKAEETCSVWGDPHYVTFSGEEHETANPTNDWYHAILSKDCLFDVQTQAPSQLALTSQAAARMGDVICIMDYVSGDFKSNEGDSPDSDVVVTKDSTTQWTMKSESMGLEVSFDTNNRRTTIIATSPYFVENSRGACTVGFANTLFNTSTTENLCGEPSNLKGDFLNDKAQFPLVDQFENWKQNKLDVANYCHINYCKDASNNVALDDIPVPETVLCAEAVVGIPVVPDDFDLDAVVDNTCGVFNSGGACFGKSQDEIHEALATCRTVLEKSPFLGDCPLMEDACGGFEPTAVAEKDAPCVLKEVNEDNIVPRDDFEYATLDFERPQQVVMENLDGACHSSSFLNTDNDQRFAQIPLGWEIVPDDDEAQVRALIADGNVFGTPCLSTDTKIFPTSDDAECPDVEDARGAKVLKRDDGDSYQCLAVKLCPLRILIRRGVSEPIDDGGFPSRIYWSLVGGNDILVANRGHFFPSQLTWVKGGMTNTGNVHSKMVYDVMQGNNLVVNFVRASITNEYSVCIGGGNSQPDTTAHAVVDVTTTPPYPLFWTVQQHAHLSDRFQPVLYGDALQGSFTFPTSDKPHVSCFGPLDVSGRHCFEMKVSGASNLNDLHVMGKTSKPQPLESLTTVSLSGNTTLKFCPQLVTPEQVIPSTCAA